MVEEIWKEIPDYPDYRISNFGRVKSLKLKKERILKPRMNNCRYLEVKLFNEAGIKLHKVHRLVGKAFVENPEGKPEINHKNGDKTDNKIDNLDWVTRSENLIHAYETGLKTPISLKGEKHGRAKLTDKIVKEIFMLLHEGRMKQSDIAKRYEISDSRVSHIKNGKTWSHITEGGF